jgi:hypothetical protein
MIKLKNILTEITIPRKIENLMRRTRFSNNRDFWKGAPKYMKQSKIEKKNQNTIWKFIDSHPDNEDEINKKWREFLKNQKTTGKKYK